MKRLLPVFLISLFLNACMAQQVVRSGNLQTGASQMSEYLPMMKGKSIGIVANPTSVINSVHLVDTLLKSGVNVKAVFGPEHGFRGTAADGETVKSGIDAKTGLKVISLYGDHKKPLKSDLEGINLVVFDIQDVGTRFYTYISTLQYVMEACAENKIPLLVLDRPNPHGFYIDGPVLDTAYRSFVGMNPIPVVHGLTMAEYALMLNGEKWLKNSVQCELYYIKMKGWDHNSFYELPVRPSPNLPNTAAIMLYPSLCFFEGTPISIGRGTEYPFQCIGYEGNKEGDFEFTPQSIPGVAKNPPQENKLCKGYLLNDFGNNVAVRGGKLYLNWLLQVYQSYPDTSKFFTPYFEKLSGTKTLREQIKLGWTEEQIRNSWGPELEKYRLMRKKYLLYRDFE